MKYHGPAMLFRQRRKVTCPYCWYERAWRKVDDSGDVYCPRCHRTFDKEGKEKAHGS